jgi:hypothetical protein
MVRQEELARRHQNVLDIAPAHQLPRSSDEFLWRPEDLARHLHLGTIGMIRDSLSRVLVTEADGWIKIGTLDRFISRVVKARVDAGLFGQGLDEHGRPVSQAFSSSATNIALSPGSGGGQLRKLRVQRQRISLAPGQD